MILCNLSLQIDLSVGKYSQLYEIVDDRYLNISRILRNPVGNDFHGMDMVLHNGLHAVRNKVGVVLEELRALDCKVESKTNGTYG